MSPKSKSVQALSRAAVGSSSVESVCVSCRRVLQLQRQSHRRRYASAATAAVAESPISSSPQDPTAPSSQTPAIRPAYQLHAGILLSRAPLLTRDLTPFEKAFYFYQRRLNERLALPFTRYFYIQRGTPEDVEWKRKIRERLTPARDIGVYNAYNKESWNDELLVGDQTSEPERQVDALLRDAESADVVVEGAPVEEAAAKVEENTLQAQGRKDGVERPVSRITAADRDGDERSLNRLGWRSLYLLVKDKSGRWRLPSARLAAKESLLQGAERVIVQAGGVNMNTWIVGNTPVGHYASEFTKPILDAEKGTVELGEKIFFMKGRIMTGQADLKANALELQDFKWLAKEEVKSHVDSKYYSMVEDMLAER